MRLLLARVYACHAQFCGTEGRWGEIGPLAQRSLAARARPDPGSATLFGQREVGLPLAKQACRLAAQCDPVELYLRRLDYVRLLLEAGSLGEALRVLPEPGRLNPADVLLLLAEVHRQTGNQAEAQDWLQQATDLIAARGLDRLRRKANAVARRF
jgi:hypothetical protein